MNVWNRAACAATILALCGACAAQDSKPKAEPKAPAASEPSKSDPAWPAAKKKRLYGTDFRGKKAPEFYVQQFLTPEPDRKGKVVLIDFWATWCGPCREAIPEINEFQKKFKDDLVCIGVSDEAPATVKAFAKKTPMEYTSAIDQTKKMNKELGVAGIPHVIIISTDGIVRWQGFPLMSEDRLTEEVIKQIIDADPGVQARHAKESGKGGAKKPAADGRPAPEKKGEAPAGSEKPSGEKPEPKGPGQ